MFGREGQWLLYEVVSNASLCPCNNHRPRSDRPCGRSFSVLPTTCRTTGVCSARTLPHITDSWLVLFVICLRRSPARRKQNHTQRSPGSKLNKLGSIMQKHRIGSISVSHSLFSSYSAGKREAGLHWPPRRDVCRRPGGGGLGTASRKRGSTKT